MSGCPASLISVVFLLCAAKLFRGGCWWRKAECGICTTVLPCICATEGFLTCVFLPAIPEAGVAHTCSASLGLRLWAAALRLMV